MKNKVFFCFLMCTVLKTPKIRKCTFISISGDFMCHILWQKWGKSDIKHIKKFEHMDMGSPSVDRSSFFVVGDTGRCDSEMTYFSDLLSFSFASRYC